VSGKERQSLVSVNLVLAFLIVFWQAACLMEPAGAQTGGESHKTAPSNCKQHKARADDAPCLSWIKLGIPVKAVLLCVHGLGLYSKSWTKFGQDMSRLGIATYALDVQGFGSFLEAKGRNKCDFSNCLKNVEKTLECLRKSNPGKPVFLMGESMGGAIALHVAAESPQLVDGIISVCSAADRFKQKKTDLNVFLHMVTGPTRKFDIGSKIVDQAAGENAELKEKWQGDALDRMKLTPMELMQFQHFMNENHEVAAKISATPVLMVQGGKDALVKPEGTEELFDELKTSDKQIMIVENAAHLIFEEGQYTQLSLAGVSDWIFDHCPAVESTFLTFDEAMSGARSALDAGQLQQAQRQLKNALRLKPLDAGAHFLMGQLQTRLRQPFLARQHLVRASRLAGGSTISQDANKALLALPQNFLAPRRLLAPGTKEPTVLVFNAKWCQPTEDMNKIVEQSSKICGSRVKFLTVDVDDPANKDLVERYAIGPVPTTVFLTPAGDLVWSQVGYGGMAGMLKGLAKLVPGNVAAAASKPLQALRGQPARFRQNKPFAKK
jgi:acylglycerol lipase